MCPSACVSPLGWPCASPSPSAWLARTDAAGRKVDAPVRLTTNTPVRVSFDVQWDPIEERAANVARTKAVRPTGKITVRWNEQSLDVPVSMVVRRR